MEATPAKVAADVPAPTAASTCHSTPTLAAAAAPGTAPEPPSSFSPAAPAERGIHGAREHGVHQSLPEVVAASALPAHTDHNDEVPVDDMPEVVRISLEESLNVKPKSIGSLGHPDGCQLPCKFVWTVKGCKDGDKCLRCHCCSWKKTRSPTQPQETIEHSESGQVAPAAKVPRPAFTTAAGKGTRKRQDKRARRSSREPQQFDPQFISQLEAKFPQGEPQQFDPQFITQLEAKFPQEDDVRINALVEQTPPFQCGFMNEFIRADMSEESADFQPFAPYDAPDFQANWSISSSSERGSKESRHTPPQQSLPADDVQSPSHLEFGPPLSLLSSWRPDVKTFSSMRLDRGEEVTSPSREIAKESPCYIDSNFFKDIEVRNCFLHIDGPPEESAFRRDDWEARAARSEPGVGKWAGIGPIRRSF